MTTAYELKLQKFSGPIEKLLELIEEKKLSITQVSLAEVTAEFLNYLKTIEKAEPGLLADFVAVASRLLLIKSKALLPSLELSEEEEEDIKDLEERLKAYQEFKHASQHIKNLWRENQQFFAREFLSGLNNQSVFYPPAELSGDMLYKAAAKLLTDVSQFLIETKNVKISAVSLEEKMQELLQRIKTSAAKFNELTKEKDKKEIVVLFLAILHLIKAKLIQAEQGENFSEIQINNQQQI